MKQLACLLLIFFSSCGRAPDPCTYFQGTAMEKQYNIAIGKKLTRKEKRCVNDAIEAAFAEADRLLNGSNPCSELSLLNSGSAGQAIPLSDAMQEILRFCDRIVLLSGGRFDPTVEPLSRLWGEALKSMKTPDPIDEQKACDAIGWSRLSFLPNSLQKSCSETKIALSAIAKGLSVDRIADLLQKMGHRDFFIEWGGAIRASGTHPTQGDWVVPVNPALLMKGQAIPPIPLRNAAIAVSGEFKKKGWILLPEASPDKQTHRYFHIIDPQTAQPLEQTPYSIAAAAVIAPSCALADALATAAMVFPSRKDAEKWAQEIVELHPDVSFWILSYDDKR
jgi:thiamine biosynthesis lipoprotein